MRFTRSFGRPSRACSIAVASTLLGAASTGLGQLTLVGQFDTPNAVGLAFDGTTGDVWLYPSFGASIDRYSASGTPLGSVPRPGESANDADVDFTSGPLTLGTTALPDGTLLFINGESGTADIYAIDKSTGTVLAMLATEFGASHVVGGAHHQSRGTLFLIQDAVPSGTINDNLVAEVNAQTGQVISSWHTTTNAPGFTIDFGDVEVAGNGNILAVSADETAVAEFTPSGALVALHALPAGVGALAGIGVNAAWCEWWVTSTAGLVSRLSLPSGSDACGCYPDCERDGDLDVFDYLCFLGETAAMTPYGDCERDGDWDVFDFLCFQGHYAGGC